MRILARTLPIYIVLMVILQGAVANGPADTPKGYVPPNGFVPTREAAVAVAEVLLKAVYGKELIESERPFKAVLSRDVWVVTGTVPCHNPPPRAVCPGGAAEIRIAKKSAQILFMAHYQ